jgi:WD40 repeat protein
MRKELKTFAGHEDRVTALAFAPDGKTLASGSRDSTIRLWDLATGIGRRKLVGQEGEVRSLAFFPDGKTLASGSRNSICLWEAETGWQTCKLDSSMDWHQTVSTQPRALQEAVSTGKAETWVRQWMPGGENILANLRAPGGIAAVAFSADGQWAAVGHRDRHICLRELPSGKELRRLEGHATDIHSVATSLDCQMLASSAGSGIEAEIFLWETATGNKMQQLKGHGDAVGSLAFSPDGRMLASGSWDSTTRLWDLTSGQRLRTLKGHSLSVYSIAFSPDGRRLASGGSFGTLDKPVRLWEVDSGKQIAKLSGHRDKVFAVAFSPDGTTLASGSEDKTIKLWPAE